MNVHDYSDKMEKYLAIGDIHGCPTPLLELLEIAGAYPEHQLIFLGDYIDRGAEPNRVINILREQKAIFLTGNHEVMLFDVCESVQSPDFKIQFLETRDISLENYDWLRRNCRFKYETEDYFFSHAGVNPARPLSQQTNMDLLWSIHEGSYESITEKLVIHGHNSVEEPTITGNNINVDTFCGKNGPLTGVLLPELKFLRSESSGLQVTTPL